MVQLWWTMPSSIVRTHRRGKPQSKVTKHIHSIPRGISHHHRLAVLLRNLEFVDFFLCLLEELLGGKQTGLLADVLGWTHVLACGYIRVEVRGQLKEPSILV